LRFGTQASRVALNFFLEFQASLLPAPSIRKVYPLGNPLPVCCSLCFLFLSVLKTTAPPCACQTVSTFRFFVNDFLCCLVSFSSLSDVLPSMRVTLSRDVSLFSLLHPPMRGGFSDTTTFSFAPPAGLFLLLRVVFFFFLRLALIGVDHKPPPALFLDSSKFFSCPRLRNFFFSGPPSFFLSLPCLLLLFFNPCSGSPSVSPSWRSFIRPGIRRLTSFSRQGPGLPTTL